MNILEKIIATKHAEVWEAKKERPVEQLMESPLFARPLNSLRQTLMGAGIIAEIKRRSPSKGVINNTIQVSEVAVGYTKAGASAISVLTDATYFGGSLADLQEARQATHLPILRKDFMVDEYQLYEAKANGADLILLIAAALRPAQAEHFVGLAHELNLEVLLELHDEAECRAFERVQADLFGINNRSLKTFEVSLETSLRLKPMLPSEKPAIAESGIDSLDAIKTLKAADFKGFLMGQHFMQNTNPGKACADFIDALNK